MNNVCVQVMKRNLHLFVVSSASKVHLFGCGSRFYVDSNRQDKTSKKSSNHHLELFSTDTNFPVLDKDYRRQHQRFL